MAAVALSLAMVGCDRSNPTAAGPSGGAPSLAAPSDARGAAEAKALAAYRGMWAAYQHAGLTANPDDPELAKYATGSALQVLTGGLRSIRDRGLVAKGSIALSPRVMNLRPASTLTHVDVADCADDSAALLYKKDGQLHNDTPGGRRAVTATVEDTGGGVWKVTSFAARQVGTC